jgi:hypothetical protein
MSRRKDRIINFFTNLLANVDEINLEKTIQESLGLFEEITHIMKSGTKQEQEEVQNAMKIVNEKVTEQFNSLCDEYGISKEEVKKLINDPNNFSPEVFDIMKNLQTKVASNEGESIKEKVKVKRKPKQWVSA